ncbi:hypothetical protein BLA23254_07419 [Burkholderia lata]|uniref:Uncharacterized protein n=1 Tax=Burkholderia lata (strain ATCC 17760 / DSM 23089 / LMG 22485 / NCIMB 9086 / R18194 / 383) TaxID=482957 RepID=A0A6P2SCH9_BURL3|nr:hypothetical protein BLA23254_07419 [Burkholderia lata]
MRKDALLKALSDPDNAFNQQEPPERVVFLYDEESKKCSSILDYLIQTSLEAPTRPGNRHALPLPDVDLPLIF